jgi:protocatechuate 3,4-dioxygenase beta subunit
MEALEQNYIIIKSSDLVEEKPYYVKATIPKKESYDIKGTIYDENLNPIPNAAIEIMEINKISGESKIIGNIFSNKNGEYIFSVCPTMYVKYKITAYSSLIIDSKDDTK